MAPVGGIATFVSGSVNNALNTFVTQTSTALSAGLAPIVATGLSIWAITYGLATMRQEVNEPIMGFVKYFLKVSIILGIALSSGVYQSEIVEGVYAMTNWLISMVVPGSSGDIYTVIDQFDAKVSELGLVIIGHGFTLLPWGGWLDLLAGLITLVGSAIMVLILIGFSITATVATKFMLGIGPAFIASLCFPPIAKFFESWMSKVVNYMFLTMGLAVASSMALTIIGAYVNNFTSNQGTTNEIADAIGLVVAEGAILVLIWQMPNIASGLAGGAALSGGGVGAFVAGMLAKQMTGGDKDKKKEDEDGGGSVEKGGGGSGGSGRAGGGNSSGGGGGGSGGRVPAYRRAALDRLQYTDHKDIN